MAEVTLQELRIGLSEAEARGDEERIRNLNLAICEMNKSTAGWTNLHQPTPTTDLTAR